MIVVKFGGTSLADADGLRARIPIVAERTERGCLVVASAMAGVSRALLELAWTRQAEGIEAANRRRDALLERHGETLAALDLPHDTHAGCARAFEEEGESIDRILGGAAANGRVDPAGRDRLLATGELLSSRMLAGVLQSAGLPARWIDPRELVASDDRFGGARYDTDRTASNVRAELPDGVAAGELVVTGGFIARTAAGDTTTLGWGASDTSATLLGRVLGADEVEIWTDVDGIATADPRQVERPRTIATLSFSEACDLTFFGAQVLHYSALGPVRAARIPLRVRNSFRPERAGTLIRAAAELGEPEPGVRGLALAGPMSRPELDGLAGCGLDADHRAPPWALVKNRTFPFDGTAATEAPHAIVTLVGLGAKLDDTLTDPLRTAAARALPSTCPVHRSFVVDAEQGGLLLRALHARLFD